MVFRFVEWSRILQIEIGGRQMLLSFFLVDISHFFVLSPHWLPERIFFLEIIHTLYKIISIINLKGMKQKKKDSNKAVGFWM